MPIEGYTPNSEVYISCLKDYGAVILSLTLPMTSVNGLQQHFSGVI